MSFEKQYTDEKTFREIVVERLEQFVNVINQMCIGFITIYMTWLCIRNGLTGTALHAWLVTLGFSLLMAEGIMCFYNGNIFTNSYKHFTRKIVHVVLLVAGGALGVAGALLKLITHKFQLFNIHAKLGFATFIFCLVTMLSGLCALFPQPIRKVFNPLLNKTVHNVLGLTTFVLALVTQYYGYEMKLVARNVYMDFEILLKVVTLVELVLTCIGPLKSFYHKIRSIVESFS